LRRPAAQCAAFTLAVGKERCVAQWRGVRGGRLRPGNDQQRRTIARHKAGQAPVMGKRSSTVAGCVTGRAITVAGGPIDAESTHPEQRLLAAVRMCAAQYDTDIIPSWPMQPVRWIRRRAADPLERHPCRHKSILEWKRSGLHPSSIHLLFAFVLYLS